MIYVGYERINDGRLLIPGRQVGLGYQDLKDIFIKKLRNDGQTDQIGKKNETAYPEPVGYTGRK